MSKLEILLNKWLEEQSSSLISEGYRETGRLGTCTRAFVHTNGNRILVIHNGQVGTIIKNRRIVKDYEPKINEE